MDYEKMWNQLKDHYEKRVVKLENKSYDSSINPRTMSKSVLNVMEHIEYKETR